jgi:hypothetical protein
MATTAADWSDPARYAYASLLALSLNERHSHESCDPEFRQQSLRRLLEHVKLMRVCYVSFLVFIFIDISISLLIINESDSASR